MIKLLARQMKSRMKKLISRINFEGNTKNVFKDILPAAFVFPFILQQISFLTVGFQINL